MKVQILSVTVTTKQGKKPYQNADVAYKNLDQGKVESKNITQYSNVFKQVAESAPGQVFNIVTEKDTNGYWQWIKMDREVEGTTSTPAPSQAPAARAAATPAPRSNYETPEERAKKQIYIVRQSSLTAAINTLSVGAKTPPKTDEVIGLARKFTDFVFDADNPETGKEDLFELPNDLEVE